ncbi:MAG: 4Fe-4S dicluster domain-containing protein [Dehalococcoidales bacterium]|jgi:MinD superfamily P-loop ATPase
MGDMPIIDEAKCQVCGLCVSVCACNALKVVDNRVKAVKTDECRWCTLCELVCPYGAISCPFEIVFDDNQP